MSEQHKMAGDQTFIHRFIFFAHAFPLGVPSELRTTAALWQIAL